MSCAADVFQLISDPTRRRILHLLADGEKAVMQLVACFDMSQPSVSEHLRVLRDGGLVTVRKEGRRRLYRLQATRLREVAEWVAAYERFWDDKLLSLGRYLDTNARANEMEGRDA
jgi:DNA-binding transcriptional ArsR family regulator